MSYQELSNIEEIIKDENESENSLFLKINSNENIPNKNILLQI